MKPHLRSFVAPNRVRFGAGVLACLALLLAAAPALAQNIEVTWSQEPEVAVPGETVLVRVQVHSPDADVTADANFFVYTGGLTAVDAGGSWGGCTFDLPNRDISCPAWTFEVEDTYEWWMILDVPADYTNTGIQAFYQHSNGDTLDSNHVVPVVPSADLAVTKYVEPSPVVRAGETFTYTIYVDNFGPSVSRNVVVQDTLLNSGDVTIQSCAFSVSQGGGSITQFTCTTGSLISTQFGTDIGTFATNFVDPLTPTTQGRLRGSFRLVAQEDIDLTNVVRVASDTPDPDYSNNEAYTAIAVEAVADLAVSCVAGAAVNAGEPASWTFTVTNNGPSTAEGVAVTLPLDAGLVDGTVTLTGPAQGACTEGTPGDPLAPLACSLGNLAFGASVSFIVTADVDPSLILKLPGAPSTGAVSGDAWVTADTFDPDTGNNRATDDVAVTASADLSLQKFAVGTPVAGEIMHYEVQVENAGPSSSANVTLRDFLPGEVEFISASVLAPGGAGPSALPCTLTEGTNVLFCPLGDIEPTVSTPVMIFYNVRIDPGATGSISNFADVNLRDTDDPNTADNNDSVTSIVVTEADLEMMVAAEPQKVSAGEQVRYTLRVANRGPSNAAGVAVNAFLPLEADYEIDTGNCLLIGTDPDILDCWLGTLPAGEAREFVVWARIVPETIPGAVVQTVAIATDVAGPPDPDPADNLAAADLLVMGKADLKVLVFGTQGDEVPAGEILTYTIVAYNQGPGFGHDVTVGNFLASEGDFEILSVTSDRPAFCAPTSGVFTGNVPVGCSLTDPLEVMTPTDSGFWSITITVTALEALHLDSVVGVQGGDPDPDMSNNVATVAYSFESVADLSLDASAVPGEVYPGDEVSLTLTVTNDGPSLAAGVRVRSLLPGGVTLQDAWVEGGLGSCAGVDPLVCGLGSIPSGESRIIQVQAATELGLTPGASLHFGAQVSSDVNDDDTTDNFASAYVRVLSLLLFSDDFSDGNKAGDPDWDTVTGAWKVNLKKELVSRMTMKNLAVANDPAVAFLAAGSLETEFKLTDSFVRLPRGAVVFGFQDADNYRYVSVVKRGARGRVIIGQTGDYAGETQGIKAKGAAKLKIGVWSHLRVDVHPDGWVKVYVNGKRTPSVSYRFPSTVPGGIGCRVLKAVARFDDFSAWYESVLP